MKVNSTIKINTRRIHNLSAAAIKALEKTGEALHTEVIQAQVIPRDTGAMQNESTFVDYSDSKNGSVTLVTSSPQARRLYYHPEYHFQTKENPDARGEWYEDWLPGGKMIRFARTHTRSFINRKRGCSFVRAGRYKGLDKTLFQADFYYVGKLDAKKKNLSGCTS